MRSLDGDEAADFVDWRSEKDSDYGLSRGPLAEAASSSIVLSAPHLQREKGKRDG